MKVAQITGWSGAGKTTLIVELIKLYMAQGLTVGAIKHTHHQLDQVDDREDSDTGRFRAAGATAVMLAGPEEAILGTRRIRYERPTDLLAAFATSVVIVEGFKSYTGWPRIEVRKEARLSAADAAKLLDLAWRK